MLNARFEFLARENGTTKGSIISLMFQRLPHGRVQVLGITQEGQAVPFDMLRDPDEVVDIMKFIDEKFDADHRTMLPEIKQTVRLLFSNKKYTPEAMPEPTLFNPALENDTSDTTTNAAVSA